MFNEVMNHHTLEDNKPVTYTVKINYITFGDIFFLARLTVDIPTLNQLYIIKCVFIKV